MLYVCMYCMMTKCICFMRSELKLVFSCCTVWHWDQVDLLTYLPKHLSKMSASICCLPETFLARVVHYCVVVEDLYYVRVVGSLDSSFPAKVAAPWTPSSRQADNVTLCSPFKCSSLDGSTHGSPRESPVTVKACAGPMSASQVSHTADLLCH